MFDYSLVGIVVILAGVALIFIATVATSKEEKDGSKVKAAGVVMIGPIPIIFGNDTKWVVVAIILAIVLLALGLLTNLR